MTTKIRPSWLNFTVTIIIKEKISAIVSIIVAISVLFASYFQWWNITYNGKLITKTWVKCLFAILIVFLITALFLII